MGKSPPPVPTDCFVRFLIWKRCYEAKGTNHNKWKCPGCMRSIIFDRDKKEIPYLHVQTNMQNMGVSMKDFKEWMKENC